jgi:hypothetical protein
MNRIFVRVGVIMSAVLFTGAMMSACAHNNASIFIRQVFAPVIPTNGLCAYTADTTQASISSGLIDLSYSGLANYTPEVLVGNQIVSQGNSNALQAETSRVIINGAITRITDLNGNTSLVPMFSAMCKTGDQAACTVGKALNTAESTGKMVGTISAPTNPFSTVETTAIEPASSATASYATLALTIVDTTTMSIMRQYFEAAVTADTAGTPAVSTAFTNSIQLLTYTQVVGSDLGNDTLESNEFEFAVTFTYGALVSNLFTDSNVAGGYCIDTAITVPMTAQVCVAGQDAPAIVSGGSIPNVPNCPIVAAAAGH